MSLRAHCISLPLLTHENTPLLWSAPVSSSNLIPMSRTTTSRTSVDLRKSWYVKIAISVPISNISIRKNSIPYRKFNGWALAVKTSSMTASGDRSSSDRDDGGGYMAKARLSSILRKNPWRIFQSLPDECALITQIFRRGLRVEVRYKPHAAI